MSIPLFPDAKSRDAWIEANAVYFTAVRSLGRRAGIGPRVERNFERREFASRAKAEASAPGDGRTMIYAVAADGQSAHLGNV